ncbi:MAG: hypothetical protein H7329_04810 [Opitutaceae bacterium]|nr:hypothetical protein [Cytophagales bacterium]
MKLFKTILFYSLLISECFAGELTVVGEYHGKNLYIQNPYSSEKNEYCVKEVYLNKQKITTPLNTSAFEIDLSGLEIHSQVIIKVVYKDDCKPKILNLNVIKTHVKFHFSDFSIDDQKLTWTTTGEKLSGKFFIEKSLHNSWVVIKDIESNGGLGVNHYSIEEIHHSGSNKYRIKFKEGIDHFQYSKVIEYHSRKKAILFSPKKATDFIKFSDTTDFEIVNSEGNSLLKGRGISVNVSNLVSGVYFLNLDNRTEKFIKR